MTVIRKAILIFAFRFFFFFLKGLGIVFISRLVPLSKLCVWQTLKDKTLIYYTELEN